MTNRTSAGENSALVENAGDQLAELQELNTNQSAENAGILAELQDLNAKQLDNAGAGNVLIGVGDGLIAGKNFSYILVDTDAVFEFLTSDGIDLKAANETNIGNNVILAGRIILCRYANGITSLKLTSGQVWGFNK